MYIKDGIKTSMPMFSNVINPSQEFILANGWQLYEEPEQVPHAWDIDKPVRVMIPAEVREGWLIKKREHEETFELTGISLYPDLIALLEFVKYEMANDTFIVNGNTNIYVYLEYLLPEHEAIIVKWGGIVELKKN